MAVGAIVGPIAWRVRHDAFAVAVRALRRASPQGPQPDALAALQAALNLHIAYEETQLWPRYAAPQDGPGSLRALLRDHRFIETHLAASATDDALDRALALAKLEGVLEHHDQREGRYVLPALEALNIVIELDEPPILGATLRACPPKPVVSGAMLDLMRGLAIDAPIEAPPVPEHPKGPRLHARLMDALRHRTGPLEARREAGLQAFDALRILSHLR